MTEFVKIPHRVEAFRHLTSIYSSQGVGNWLVSRGYKEVRGKEIQSALAEGGRFWCQDNKTFNPVVHSPGGVRDVGIGDWLVKYPDGNIYPMKHDVFQQRFELPRADLLESMDEIVEVEPDTVLEDADGYVFKAVGDGEFHGTLCSTICIASQMALPVKVLRRGEREQ